MNSGELIVIIITITIIIITITITITNKHKVRYKLSDIALGTMASCVCNTGAKMLTKY